MSVSHRHIIISFLPGLDGGYSQTITCQYRTGSDDFREANSRQYALGYLDYTELTVSDALDADTAYSIRLVSDNEYPEGRAAESDVITVTTRGKLYMYAVHSALCSFNQDT